MHRIESHRQGVQKKYFDERQDVASKCGRVRVRYRFEEKIDQSESSE